MSETKQRTHIAGWRAPRRGARWVVRRWAAAIIRIVARLIARSHELPLLLKCGFFDAPLLVMLLLCSVIVPAVFTRAAAAEKIGAEHYISAGWVYEFTGFTSTAFSAKKLAAYLHFPDAKPRGRVEMKP